MYEGFVYYLDFWVEFFMSCIDPDAVACQVIEEHSEILLNEHCLL